MPTPHVVENTDYGSATEKYGGDYGDDRQSGEGRVRTGRAKHEHYARP